MTGYGGQCACGAIRYQMRREPMIVHCCHCTWCQRETGSAFVINAVIEASEVSVLGIEPEVIDTPSASGRGQLIARCPHCHIALWSHYSSGRVINYVRVGTMDEPALCPPDIHIFTSTKLPWVRLPEGARAFDDFYDTKAEWSEEALTRWMMATGL